MIHCSRTTRTAPPTGICSGRCWRSDCRPDRRPTGSPTSSRPGCPAARSTRSTREWRLRGRSAWIRWSRSDRRARRYPRSATPSLFPTARRATGCPRPRWTSTVSRSGSGSAVPSRPKTGQSNDGAHPPVPHVAGYLRCRSDPTARNGSHRRPDGEGRVRRARLLGGGSRFLGVTEDCAAFLQAALTDTAGDLPTDDAGWDALALQTVLQARAGGRFVPGLGHPVHKVLDPRTPVLIGIAEQEGLRGPYLKLFEAIGRVHEQVLGRRLPLNGAGVCGAALADLGLPVEMLRGFALLARAAGLLGQLAEERRRPIGMDVYLAVDRNAEYVAPQSC